MNSQSFVGGAFILAVSNLFVKILGSVFRIPLGNLIEAEGLGYYQTAYPVYTFILAASTTGLPVAISKMVAERTKLGDYKSANKVFKVSLLVLSFIGIVSFCIFFFFAKEISLWLNDINAYYSVKALSLALLIVPVAAAFRGYFQGRSNMVPTSVSQFFEQLARVAVGLFLAYYFLPKGKNVAAGGASFGASAGGIASILVVVIIYLKNLKKINYEISNSQIHTEESSQKILREMLYIAVPIIIGSMVTPMLNVVDSKLVKLRLVESGFSKENANILFGQYSGMAATIINLPQSLTMSVSMSIVPAISQGYIIKNYRQINKNILLGTRLTNLIAMPCMIGIMVLSTQIMNLLYPKEPDSIGQILFVMSFTVVFVGILQTYTAVLQALGRPMIPVINLFIASIFKIFLTYFLTYIPALNVKGAAIGSVVTYAMAAILNYIHIKRLTKVNIKAHLSYVKPLFMSVIMGIFVKVTYVLSLKIIGHSKISTILAILVGVVVYGYQVIFMGGVSRKELESSKIGRKIVSIFFENRKGR